MPTSARALRHFRPKVERRNGLPVGLLERDETPEAGVRREIWEESGIHVEVDELTGVYKNTARGIVVLVPLQAGGRRGANPQRVDGDSSVREQPNDSPFRADMKAPGKQGGWESRAAAKVPAPAEIAARLGIDEGDLCVRIVYEFLADGKLVQLSTNLDPYDLTGGTLSSPQRVGGRTPGWAW